PWRPAPRWLDRAVMSGVTLRVVRAMLLAAFALVLTASAFGSTRLNENIAPLTIFVVWWAGLVPVSVALGNVWQAVNPWVTIARIIRLPDETRHEPPPGMGWWPAAFVLVLWAWVELVYPTAARPRLIAALIVGYSVLTLGGMARYGVARWLERGEAFSVYTRVLATLAPVEVRDRRLGFRPPLVGVTRLSPGPAVVAFIIVLIGTVTFDGLSGSRFWEERDVIAAQRLIERGIDSFTAGIVVATIGLLVTLAIVLAAYEGCSWLAARLGGWGHGGGSGRAAIALAHSLVPIALAYVVAHYFTLFVFQSQDLIRLASDPFGRGADIFGTADHRIDFQLVSANAIWAVQVAAIVIGHVAALALAHDRALELSDGHRAAIRSQVPMLALMVALTVAGLWSLSEGMAET
nr:fenitrothion hydrolase [Actinomycetota bacterium]